VKFVGSFVGAFVGFVCRYVGPVGVGVLYVCRRVAMQVSALFLVSSACTIRPIL